MVFHIYKDTAGYWRWRLKAANYQIIAVSGEGYYNKTDCQSAINLVKTSWNASVVED